MRKIRIFAIMFLGLLLCASQGLSSGLETKRIVTVGYGCSQVQAIFNAVKEAIKQEYGFFLSSEKLSQSLSAEVGGKFVTVSSLREKIREKLRGTVDGYKVLSLRKEPDGDYEARVEVYVTKYTPPGISINSRRRIVVYPFEGKDSYVSKLLTQAVVTFLTQSRKFSVLDRENYRYYKKEKALITSPDADKRERAKLKHLAGTDYILVGTIDDFSIVPEKCGSRMLGFSGKKFKVNYNVSYRILMFSTGQIKYSNQYAGSIVVPYEEKRIAEQVAIDKIAKVIVNDILMDIYPPVVITTENNLAIINVGNKVVTENACFDVYKKGKKLIDPYTHEFLGFDEIKIGRLIITDVKPKFSQAKVIEGYVVSGSILRPCKTEKLDSKAEFGKSDVKLLPNGGVVLPMDRR